MLKKLIYTFEWNVLQLPLMLLSHKPILAETTTKKAWLSIVARHSKRHPQVQHKNDQFVLHTTKPIR